MSAIKIEHVSIDEENGVLIIGFAESKSDPGRWLILQRTLEASEQDRALGQDVVHISMNSDASGMYGGVMTAVVYPSSIEIGLTNSAAKLFAVDQVVALNIESAKGTMLSLQMR